MPETLRPTSFLLATRPAAGPSGGLGGTLREALRSESRALTSSERGFFQARLGADLGSVRLHAGAEAARLAQGLGAAAFALGPDVVLGRPATPALLAHELAHVVQAQRRPGQAGLDPRTSAAEREAAAAASAVSAGEVFEIREAPGGAIQRQQGPLPALQPAAAPARPPQSIRTSPPGGVAITGGSLAWVVQTPAAPPSTRDAEIHLTYTPAGPASCPTVTFLQIVKATTGGVPDSPSLLFTRTAQGYSVDVLESDREPYYGVEPVPGGAGLRPEEIGGGQRAAVAGTGPGRGPRATLWDVPNLAQTFAPRGQEIRREFETAVICVESGATLGSLRWGYSKRGRSITLIGGEAGDVRATAASDELERARLAYYSGTFQHSLSGFARGSAQLTAAHRATLRGIAALRDLRRVVLVGANDNSGGPEADATLSRRRAEAARSLLVELGVASATIETQALGVAAREPNPAGVGIAANRRVDVHVERGATVPGGVIGSPLESLRLRRQSPQATLAELYFLLVGLLGSRDPVPDDSWAQLTHLLDALERWRRVDPGVPDARRIFDPWIRSLRARRPGGLSPADVGWEPPPDPSFLQRIVEDARRVPG